MDVSSSAGGANENGGATSETDGLYTVSHLPPGVAYTVFFDPSCNGSSPYLLQYYNGASEASAATTVTPTATSPAGRIDAHLVLGASISGTVTDAHGATITSADICVSARANDGASGSATSDATGKYSIVGLPADSYDVTASDCSGSTRNDLTSDHGSNVTVTASQAIASINIKLAAATSISGHVYGGSGTVPVASVCADALTTGPSGTFTQTASSAGDGSYTIDHLAPGTAYDVEFDPSCAPNGRYYSVEYYNGATSASSATAVTPTLATPADGIDAHLPSAASISGQITDASGSPIKSQDVCVVVESTGSSFPIATTTTDSSGDYQLNGLSAGSYNVSATDCAGSTREDLPSSYGSALTLTSSQAATAINIKMTAGTSISGHLYGGSGTTMPLNGACVSAYPSLGGTYSTGSTLADGSYSLSHLTPGVAYVVQFNPSCSTNGRQYVSEYYNGTTNYSQATQVSATASMPGVGIDGHLPVGATISGTISDAHGSAITSGDVCVSATASEYPYTSVVTDGLGHYTLEGLPAGTYAVSAADCSYSSRDDSSASLSGVTVTTGQALTGQNLELGAGTSISGHVYGGTGTLTPLQYACVDVYPAGSSATNPPIVASAQTTADGSYTVGHLAAGAYVVQFQPCSAGSQYTSEYYNGEQSYGTANVVSPTATSPATAIDAHLPYGATISGTVSDASGTPITTGDICVAAEPYSGGAYASTTTTDTGAYTITGLSAGSYYVEFQDCSGSTRNDLTQWNGGASTQSASTLVVLSFQGAQTGVDARMQAATKISGTVYAGAGTTTPLSNVCVTVTPEAFIASDTRDYHYATTTGTERTTSVTSRR